MIVQADEVGDERLVWVGEELIGLHGPPDGPTEIG